ncbi:MAG TPA: hypothetical protein GXX42_13840 [Petrimonas sp.]|uniref:hypothetical protein n=1 Tax=Petrimonas sp. TaxID=2023866 RepID=UPI00175D4A92|nr:hypothetical protein [Petrimonas sp.]
MNRLETEFTTAGIDFSKVGFYDDPNFLICEQRNHRYLETYAEYVLTKKYAPEYIERAKKEIPFIANLLNEELIKDGRLGACIDISIGLSRILEQEGFWNYIPKGSLTIDFPAATKIQKKFFYTANFGNFDAGHVWVVAPPFTVIDLSVKQQPYQDKAAEYLPNFICSTSEIGTKANDSDIISPEGIVYMKMHGINNGMNHIKPDWKEFLVKFKSIEVKENNVVLKYITTGISAPDMPIEKVETLRVSGRITIEIYNDIIIPKLKEFRESNQ